MLASVGILLEFHAVEIKKQKESFNEKYGSRKEDIFPNQPFTVNHSYDLGRRKRPKSKDCFFIKLVAIKIIKIL